MVLLEVHPHRVSALPLERQTPRSVHMYAIAGGPTLQSMEIESWHVDVRGKSRLVEHIQADQRTTLKILPNSGASSGLEQLSEPRVLEALDHRREVSCITRHVVNSDMTALT